MITAAQAQQRYGSPELEIAMVMWDVPVALNVGVIPRRIYCNKDLVTPLRDALYHLIHRGLLHELRTWDGCFNIRKKRGASTPSLHSWGLAIDVNAGWNRFGEPPTLSRGFVECFEDAGFDWGGRWGTKPDGMHFQLRKFPS